MTRILAIDTSTSACSVALNYQGQIQEDFIVAPQDHTQRLLPMVDKLLAEHQLALRDLDAIAFTQGPGSFTGLRIAVGVVQGLAFGADLSVIPMSTLQIMSASAQRLLSLPAATQVLPCLDARMDELYWGLYRCEAELAPACLKPDSVSAGADLLATLRAESNQAAVVVGSGAPLLDQQSLSDLGHRCHAEMHPHAYDLARFAEPLLREGRVCSALEARPAYVRNEVSWAKRQRIRS